MEFRDINLDALTGGCVEEAAAVRRGEFVLEHFPPPGMEAAVQAADRARFGGTLPPRPVDSAEAHKVSDVICEDALGDESCEA
jgi:hypothetical protein